MHTYGKRDTYIPSFNKNSVSTPNAIQLHMKGAITFFIILLHTLLSVAVDEPGPVVEIRQGNLEGKRLKSRGGREFKSFLGVPYAQAGRFEAPQPIQRWEGIPKATEYTEGCAQLTWLSNLTMGREDCLNLNVFSPDLSGNLSVLLYIHGGCFSTGSANTYGPDYLMDEDVVLVTVNYRLGPFGFLSTNDEILPGNYGLKDQSMALRWIQENIVEFGGNPYSVTIAGNSAGGASVNYQILAPQNQGLIHGAIAFSGSALVPWALSREPREVAGRYGKAVGCPLTSSEELRDCLLAKTTEELLMGLTSLVEWGYNPVTPFGPVVEPEWPGAFITEHPAVTMEAGSFIKIPYMSMVTENEGAIHAAFLLHNPKLLAEFNTQWKKVYPIAFQYTEMYEDLTPTAREKFSQKIRDNYFRKKDATPDSPQELIDVFSDRFIVHGTEKAARLLRTHTPVYNFLFAYNRKDYSIPRAFWNVDKNYGVSHGDEISFMFSNSFGVAPEFQPGSEAERVSKQFAKLLVSFARDKSPTAQWGLDQCWVFMTPAEAQGEVPLRYYRIDSGGSESHFA